MIAPRADGPGHGGETGADARHIGGIDALRALAMMAVIAEHCKIFPPGWTGVWLFFVISGFVVTTSLASRPAETPGRLLAHFYARRAARILPIYLLYVVLGFMVSGLLSGGAEWAPFASLLLFYNNVQAAFGVGVFRAFPVGHLWTLSVEMQFYLVYGVAFAFLPRRALGVLLIALLAIAPLLRFLAGEWLSDAGFAPLRAAFAIYAAAPMHFDSFAAGALLALNRPRWSKRGRAALLLAAGAAALGVYALVYGLVNHAHGAQGAAAARNVLSGVLFGEGRQVWVYSAVALFAAGVLAETAAGPGLWSAVTDSAWLQAVGRVSYGGYIYHALAVALVGWGLTRILPPAASAAGKVEFGVLRFGLALPLTVAAAFASYRLIERPILRLTAHARPAPGGAGVVRAGA